MSTRSSIDVFVLASAAGLAGFTNVADAQSLQRPGTSVAPPALVRAASSVVIENRTGVDSRVIPALAVTGATNPPFDISMYGKVRVAVLPSACTPAAYQPPDAKQVVKITILVDSFPVLVDGANAAYTTPVLDVVGDELTVALEDVNGSATCDYTIKMWGRT